MGVGPDGLQRSLPASSILWYWRLTLTSENKPCPLLFSKEQWSTRGGRGFIAMQVSFVMFCRNVEDIICHLAWLTLSPGQPCPRVAFSHQKLKSYLRMEVDFQCFLVSIFWEGWAWKLFFSYLKETLKDIYLCAGWEGFMHHLLSATVTYRDIHRKSTQPSGLYVWDSNLMVICIPVVPKDSTSFRGKIKCRLAILPEPETLTETSMWKHSAWLKSPCTIWLQKIIAG